MSGTLDHLAASIALLWTLDPLPGIPATNAIDQSNNCTQPESTRALSFKHEIIAAQQLAFICAYSADPLHVLATCVEEQPGGQGLTIRLAANTGKHPVLLQHSQAIAMILQEEAKDVNRATNHHNLLCTVVRLNRMRILCRIRSRHALSSWARNKPSMILRLNKLKSLLPQSATASFHQKLDTIIRQLEDLEAKDTIYVRAGHTDAALLSLLINIQQLLADHEAEFRSVPYVAGSWSGHDTESLLERVRKVANYATACLELLRVARRYHIFSWIQVAFVDFQHTGPRLTKKRRSDMDLDRLLQPFIDKASSLHSGGLSKTFAAETRQAARLRLRDKSRVHAEIQIALFYEQHPEYLTPRVICSSKSACYLCNLFLQLHGKHYIPSTHGRLYDTWRWPSNGTDHQASISAFAKLLPTFKAMLDAKIQHQLCQPPLVRRADPLESRVDFAIMSPSASTIPSTIRGVSSLPRSVQLSEQHQYDIDDDSSSISPNQVCTHVQSPGSIASLNSAAIAQHSSSNSSSIITTNTATVPAPPMPILEWQAAASVNHTFHHASQTLRLRLPGLSIDVDHVSSLLSEAAPATEPPNKVPPLTIAIDYIQTTSLGSAMRLDHAVDLDECSRGSELALPEGIATTTEGLLLRKGKDLLRIRTMGAV